MSAVNLRKDLGPVTAYAIAVAGGYQGTQQQWEAEIANAHIFGLNSVITVYGR